MPNLSSVTMTGKHNVQIGSPQDCLYFCLLGGSQHAAYSSYPDCDFLQQRMQEKKRHSFSGRSGEAISSRIYRHSSCLPESCDNMHETWPAGEVHERPTAYSSCGELTLDIFFPVCISPPRKEVFSTKRVVAANGLGRSGTAVI